MRRLVLGAAACVRWHSSASCAGTQAGQNVPPSANKGTEGCGLPPPKQAGDGATKAPRAPAKGRVARGAETEVSWRGRSGEEASSAW